MKTHSVIKSEFEKKALRRYYAEKALFEGMQDKMQDTRENEYLEADKGVDAVAHKVDGVYSGNIYRTTLSNTGEEIYITGGKVVLDSEGCIDVNQSEGLVALINGEHKAIKVGDVRDKVTVESVEAQKAAKRAEIDARYKQQLNTFTYTDKADGTEHTVQLVSRGEDMARVILDGVEQDIPNNVFDEIVAETTAEASGEVKAESGELKAENGEQIEGVNAGKAESGDVVSPVETAQPVVEQTETTQLTPKQKREEIAKRIPIKGKERAWTEAEPVDVVEYISLLTTDPAKQQAAVDKFIADIKAKQEKVDAITALEMDEDVAYWENVKQMLAEKAAPAAEVAPVVESAPVAEQPTAEVVEETQTPVVEAPQAANEMQPVQEEIGSSEIPNNQEPLSPADSSPKTEEQLTAPVEVKAEGGNAVGQNAVAETEQSRANVNTHSVIKSEFEKKALRERAAKWAKKLGVRVHVLESYDEVTDESALKNILEGRTSGWFAGGEVYLYMPHLVDEVDLDRTVVHESVAHKGIKQMLGEEFNKFLDNVWNSMSVPAKAKFLSYVKAKKNATLADRRAAADEYVASIAEKVYKEQGLTAEEKNIWQKFVAWFKKKFNADEAKAEVLAKDVLDEKDIAKMVLASYSKLTENGEVETEAETENGSDFRASKVFHGSGAQFDRFDHSFMGTGEGNRVAGWGTYVTNSKNTGMFYAEIAGSKTGERHLYAVEIPDDNGKNYMDLDKEVSSSLKNKAKTKVREYLFNSEDSEYWKRNEKIIEQEWKYVERKEATGYDLRAIMEELIGDAKEVSDIFSSLGFVGFKTDTDSSQGTTYVIFNENDAQIESRTMFRIAKTPQEFDATQKEAVEKRGIVAPNLNNAIVNVVDVPRHDFTGSLKEARAQAEDWAVKNYTGREYDFPDNSGKYVISKKAIGKYLDKTAVKKSDNAAVHLSALKKLPEIISNSIEVELHADYKKDGEGRSGNEIDRDDLLIHRLYGAINIGGNTYRVKTTIREFKDVNTPNSPHSYEVTKIELIEDSTVTPDGIDSPLNRPINSISATKLLEGVEKSYDKGKKILDESENSASDGIKFRKVDWNRNRGYTQREDGSRISVRAAEAEEEGAFTPGTFRKVYGVSKADFDALVEIGAIVKSEWHHTGANFKESDFYSWSDRGDMDYTEGIPEEGSLGDIYRKNKKEISQLVKDYQSQNWEYEDKRSELYLPTLDDFASRVVKLNAEEKADAEREHAQISNAGEALGGSYYRRLMHEDVDAKYAKIAIERFERENPGELERLYEEQYGESIAFNKGLAERNKAAEEHNKQTAGKEATLLKIADMFGVDAKGKVEGVSRVAREKAKREQRKAEAETIKQSFDAEMQRKQKALDKWVADQRKKGGIKDVERIPQKEASEFFITEKEEMNGRYGWFEANTWRYNMPVYVSGMEFANKRLYDSYRNRVNEIRDAQSKFDTEYTKFLYEEGNDGAALRELVEPDEDIRFRFIGKKGAENLDKAEENITPEMKESVMEGQTMFRKMNEHAEEFNKTHKGGVPVVEIDPNNMEADFAEEGFATEEIEELKERMKKGVAAVYNTDKKIIYLLIPSQDKESVYSTCWHEDTHAAIDILGLTPEMMDEFYSFAQGKKKEAFEALLDKIGYEIEEYPEESLAYGVQAMHILDNWSAETLSKLFGSTAEGAQRQMEIIQPLIDYINNGRQGTQSSVGETVRDRGMYNNTANQKKTAEAEGTGATATGGLTEGGITEQEERTLFSKKELTPEQKKKQKALKENAKAIRRLHNVTSKYPITALRNLGFALETQEQRDMHDRLFAERDAITGESMPAGLQTNPQAMTLQERITEGILKLAEQEKENVEMRLSAIRAYGRDLANVIKLMRAQKGYDRRTVEMFTDLVKMYLRNNAMKGLSSYEIIRLLNLMQKATGGYAKTVNRAAVKIAEIITYEHTRQLEEIMEKQMKTVMVQKADGILFKLTFCHL